MHIHLILLDLGSFFFDLLRSGLKSEGPFFLSLSDYFTFWQPAPEPESGSTFFYKNALLSLLRIVFILIGVAYFTLAERKIMGAIQRRRGPNIVGLFGLLQPLADGLKLLCKEMVIPSKSNTLVFLIAPLAIIILSLVS
jgi:NADH dehydrogenase